MKNTEPQKRSRYAVEDCVCDIAMVVVLLGMAFGLLELVGSF